ncbi:MAG: ABC transporter permease, partial [Pseudomonadota bacterium]
MFRRINVDEELLLRDQVGRRQWWQRARNNKLLLFAAYLFATIFVLALFAPWIAPYEINDQDFSRKLLSPGSDHWFGTDELGRDVFSQLLHGALTSLWVGLLVVLVAAGIGTPLGLLAGYFGGRIDNIIMRLSEVFLAFPPLLLPILITAALGKGLTNAMIALAISWFPWYARTSRAAAMIVRNELYVRAGEAAGA